MRRKIPQGDFQVVALGPSEGGEALAPYRRLRDFACVMIENQNFLRTSVRMPKLSSAPSTI